MHTGHHIRTGLSAYNPKKVVGEINTLRCINVIKEAILFFVKFWESELAKAVSQKVLG